LLEVNQLAVDFRLQRHAVPALMDVSFSVDPGETVALVGESGSGKSVTSQAIMGILPTNAVIRSGEILFDNPETGQLIDIARLDPESTQMRQIRGGNISIIFQEPMTSLSPVHTIGDQVSEALFLHRDASYQEGLKLTEAMLKHVGFPDPARALRMYPFELSGGLRQRAMIAMAMITHPSLLIADEPTTALDVTIQARILKLIRELQAELGMALLLITHDLGVVSNMADQVVVMYHGRVMEAGPLRQLFGDPQHDYLKALIHAVPRFDLQPDQVRSRRADKAATARSACRLRQAAPARKRGQQNLSSPSRRLVQYPVQGIAGGRSGVAGSRARRMLRPGRRKRLRQNHAQQDHYAGNNAGSG
jgi:peptide/nickel transport system ATP-binding protein